MPCLCGQLRALARQSPRSEPCESDEYYFQQQNMPRSEAICRTVKGHENDYRLDEEGRIALSSLRQKACQYVASEFEDPARNPTHNTSNCPCVLERIGSPNLVKRANDLIDYAPQSEFLRRMKQQCQKLQNNQPNVFSLLEESSVNEPPECPRITPPRVTPPRVTPPRMTGYNTPITYRSDLPTRYTRNQQARMDSSCDAETDLPDYSLEYACGLNDKMRAQQKSRSCPSDEDLEGREGDKKSEHISRSKKPVKCRRRRKRKSGSSDKCESDDQFEPTLKRPHENSCERCWRFASPARSPVNKPDQKYDPNFRRGHSCLDFERGDGDLEVHDRHISPCKNLQAIITGSDKEKTPLPPAAFAPKTPVIQPGLYSTPVTQPRPYSTPVTQPGPYSTPVIQPRPYSSPPQRVVDVQPPMRKPQVQFTPYETSARAGENYSYLPSPRMQSPRMQSPNIQSPRIQSPRTPEISILRGPTSDASNQPIFSPGNVYCDPGRQQSYIPDLSSLEILRASDGPEGSVAEYIPSPKRISGEQISEASQLRVTSPPRQTNSSRLRPKSSSRQRPNALGTIPEADPEVSRTPGQEKTRGSEKKHVTPPKCTTKHTSPKRDSPRPGPSHAITPPPARSPKKVVISRKGKNPPFKKGQKAKQEAARLQEAAKLQESEKKSPKKSPKGSAEKPKPSPQGSGKKPKSSPEGSAKKPKSSPERSAKKPKSSPEGSAKKVKSFIECIEPNSRNPEQRPYTFDPCYGEPQLNLSQISNRDRLPTPVVSPEQFKEPDHPVKECDCFPFNSGCLEEIDPRYIMCCHCDWNEQQKNDSDSPRSIYRSPLPPTRKPVENRIPVLALSNIPLEENIPDMGYQPRPSSPREGCPPPGSSDPHNRPIQNVRGYDGRAFVCPYREEARRTPLSSGHHSIDSAWAREYQMLSDLRPKSCQGDSYLEHLSPHKEWYLPSISPQPNQNEQEGSIPERLKALVPPKKYFLFYMTQCRDKKGDDVEVLVEELTGPNKTDSRTKDITEKMKKIMECPSDSMALRFQKGVSDTCKTPQSSRILYF